MTKGLLAAAVTWVIGVEIVAWWCLSVSVLGGSEFWPAVLGLVTPCSVLAGVGVGRLAKLGWLSGQSTRQQLKQKKGHPKATPDINHEK